MATSDLVTALSNLDTAISNLTSELASAQVEQYGIEGLQVRRASLNELIAARRELAKLIQETGGNAYEEHSRWIPG